jgi:hypothetical protein
MNTTYTQQLQADHFEDFNADYTVVISPLPKNTNLFRFEARAVINMLRCYMICVLSPTFATT